MYICQSQAPNSSYPLFPNSVHMSVVPLTSLPFQGPSLRPHTGKLLSQILPYNLSSCTQLDFLRETLMDHPHHSSPSLLYPLFLLSHFGTQYCMQFFACLACPTPLRQDVNVTREGTYSLGPHSLQHPEENLVLRDT